jgi:hypothetical protein
VAAICDEARRIAAYNWLSDRDVLIIKADRKPALARFWLDLRVTSLRLNRGTGLLIRRQVLQNLRRTREPCENLQKSVLP